MANDLSQSPLVIDTASSSTVVVQGLAYVEGIAFVGATTAAHAAELTVKSSSKIFFRATATGNGYSIYMPIRCRIPGDLVLSTLDSGKVLVYLNPGER